MAATRIAILLAVLSVATAAQEVPSDSNVPPGNQPEPFVFCRILPSRRQESLPVENTIRQRYCATHK